MRSPAATPPPAVRELTRTPLRDRRPTARGRGETRARQPSSRRIRAAAAAPRRPRGRRPRRRKCRIRAGRRSYGWRRGPDPGPGAPPDSDTTSPPAWARRRAHSRTGPLNSCRVASRQSTVDVRGRRPRGALGGDQLMRPGLAVDIRQVGDHRRQPPVIGVKAPSGCPEQERCLVGGGADQDRDCGRAPGTARGSAGSVAASQTGIAPPRVPLKWRGGQQGFVGGDDLGGGHRPQRGHVQPSAGRPNHARLSACAHATPRAAGTVSSPIGGDWAMTRVNNPSASGEASRCSALPAPADWPLMVTAAGSPPNWAMLSRTHCSASAWSRRPQLAPSRGWLQPARASQAGN